MRFESSEKIPLLSQEGWREAPGWFQSGHAAGWQLRNHPSRDPLRDPAALLTQEGSFSPFPDSCISVKHGYTNAQLVR
jgi:hypothetical protein